MAELDVERFYTRLNKLHSHFVKHRATAIWGNATCLSLSRGALNEDQPYLKSVVLHQYLFGYELPDTVLIVTMSGQVLVLATRKKCEFLQPAVDAKKAIKGDISIKVLQKNKADGNEENYGILLDVVNSSAQKENKVLVGTLLKEMDENDNQDDANNSTMVSQWNAKLSSLATCDVAPGLSMVLAVKDATELDLMKKSSVLSNKLMKHGCIKKLESIIEESTKITHENFASLVEQMIEDPSEIGLKIPKEDVQSCYFPIIQSGGHYDLKVSAASNDQSLRHDVLLVSLGARYKLYCSHVCRTFLVDPPKVISDTYETLLGMHEACLKVMQPGKPLKTVYKTAVQYLQANDASDLIDKLPKNLGFCMGLEFRDPNLTLSPKNPATFRAGMVVTLISGFANVELSDKDKRDTPTESDVKKLSTYALQIADMVSITKTGAEIMTKLTKSLTDISYLIHDNADDDEDDEDDGDVPDAPEGDAAYARRLAKQTNNGNNNGGKRTSSRLAKHQEAAQEVQEGVAIRERKQIHLMTRRNEERLRELARAHARGGKEDDGSDRAEELEAYSRPRDYPDGVQPNQVKVDMANQCVILPVCGNPVPFHISTIKNVVLPDPDNATYLRINFYTAGMALGKDAPANTAKLVQKYAPYASFIREMTFRSLDSHNLTQAYRMISELRKRARTRELREQEEANLVEQEKLVRTKNERVPRLSDLTMRPVFAGRKTQGNLEAHSNGLRFISTRSEVVDVMYNNIKYAIFQPCESEIMVLIHFHLKNPIMVGKKRQIDIQFFTEVVDASQTVDAGRRSMYDPDEMDDENRERMLRKRLNQAFKDFCKKVDAVAKKKQLQH